jgi:transcriptional regulator with XRE-family HTH domain
MTTTPPAPTLGERFRQARERAGYTQERAALAIGVSRPLINHWEKGKRSPRIEHLAAMARVYDADWLWYAAGDSNPEPTDYGFYQPALFGEVVVDFPRDRPTETSPALGMLLAG